ERPFITVGFTAFLILVPLALTSTKGWIRRLGKRWTTLHKGIYLAAILGVVHFYWFVKADTRLPILFGAGLVVLLGLRSQSFKRIRKRPASAERVPVPGPLA
ncbi:MAG: ferric reductase-like transmembrane domain-containing protein, partial [Gemmatimonadota bacterium]|nr:ferric reductase-like transmembrane domain-containing protein [Gemmatimonadota bacterium]